MLGVFFSSKHEFCQFLSKICKLCWFLQRLYWKSVLQQLCQFKTLALVARNYHPLFKLSVYVIGTRFVDLNPFFLFFNSSLLWDVFIINSVEQLQTLPKTQSEIDISPFPKNKNPVLVYCRYIQCTLFPLCVDKNCIYGWYMQVVVTNTINKW